MHAQEWANVVRSLRRLHGLTREQFASIIPARPDAVTRWEEALDVPDTRAQATLRDMLCGHFHSHPTYLGLKAMVQATEQLSALYTPGLVIRGLSRPLDELFTRHRMDMLGSSMLPNVQGRSAEMVERYMLPMLEGRSEVLSLSYTDRGIADPTMILRQQVTVIPLDGIRVLATVGIPLGTRLEPGLPDAELRIVTGDDIRG